MKVQLAHFSERVCGSCTKAAISPRPKDMDNFMSKLHSIAEAVNKNWDFLHVVHEWTQPDSVELQACIVMKSSHCDVEVPCIVQWEVLWYSARNHLNNVLINVGVFQACYDITIRNIETYLSPAFLEKIHAEVCLSTEVDEWYIARQGGCGGLKGTCSGGTPLEKEGDHEFAETSRCAETICPMTVGGMRSAACVFFFRDLQGRKINFTNSKTFRVTF